MVVTGLALGLCAASAGAAVINSASLVQRGIVTELHFGVRGEGLGLALSAHGNELWIDLAHTRIDLPPRPLYGREAAPVEAVRAIDEGGARSRLVIQIVGKTDYAVGKLPHELVIRLAPAGRAPNLAAPVLVRIERRGEPAVYHRPLAPAPSAVAPMAAARPLGTAAPAQLARATVAPRAERAAQPADADRAAAGPVGLSPPPAPVPQGQGQAAAISAPRVSRAAGAVNASGESVPGHPLVVIDPGHGGYDSGTEIGAPLLEKDLALQISLRLKDELERRGVHAILTRTGDYFVTLGGRTAFANQAGADLFISIHLNSSPDASTAGIETYYLNNTTDRATIRLAAMENASGDGYSTQAGGDLHYILSDMRQQYKANESVALASVIEAQASADLEASLGFKVNALGAMRGPFYVLVGAQMPAVLVECGFLSNREEAARLASAQYQQVLAGGIAAAVVHYFNADAAVGNL